MTRERRCRTPSRGSATDCSGAVREERAVGDEQDEIGQGADQGNRPLAPVIEPEPPEIPEGEE
jgi:hypothetical protein